MYSGARPPGIISPSYSVGSTSSNATCESSPYAGFAIYVSLPSTKSWTTVYKFLIEGDAIVVSKHANFEVGVPYYIA